MKAWMLIAEAATAHPDGTISMLRVGVNRAWWQNEPIPLKANLIIRIEAEVSEKGTHDFRVGCTDEDGKPRLPDFGGTFQAPDMGGSCNFIIGLPPQLPRFGVYYFTLVVDRLELASYKLLAEKAEAKNE